MVYKSGLRILIRATEVEVMRKIAEVIRKIAEVMRRIAEVMSKIAEVMLRIDCILMFSIFYWSFSGNSSK